MEKFKVVLLGVIIFLTIAVVLLVILNLEVSIRCLITSCDKEDRGWKQETAQAIKRKLCRRACTSKHCLLTSADAFESIDDSVDPCEDFHKFTCGNYEKTTAPLDGYETSKVNDEILNVLHRVNVIITESINGDNMGPLQEAARKLKLYYQNCIYSSADTSEMLKVLRDFLPGWPYVSNDTSLGNIPLGELAGKFYLAGQPSFLKIMDFAIFDKEDIKKVFSKPFLMPDDETTLLPDIFSYHNKNLKYAYETLLQTLLIHLGFEEYTANHYTEEVLMLEYHLTEFRVNCSTTQTGQFDRTTYAASTSKWVDFFKYIFNKIESAKNISETVFWVVDPELKCVLDKWWSFLESQPKRVIANYLALRLIKENVYTVGFLLENTVRKSYEELYPYKSSVNLHRNDFCVKLVSDNFGALLAPFYKERYVSNKLLEKFEMLFSHIRSAASEFVSNLTHIDDDFKSEFQEKLRNMQPLKENYDVTCDAENVANFYSDLKLESRYFIENVVEVGTFRRIRMLLNMFNGTEVNKCGFETITYGAYSLKDEININVGLLKTPMISPERPILQDLASMGLAIGHEIGHVSHTDFINRNDISENLSMQLECFVNQYSEFKLQFSNSTNEAYMTLRENLADHFGLMLSYIAYEKLLNIIPTITSFIGLDLGEQQEYFLTQALFTCGVHTPKGEEKSKIDVHSSWRHRVWGTFMNSYAFSKAFVCPVETFMNPVEKCSLYR